MLILPSPNHGDTSYVVTSLETIIQLTWWQRQPSSAKKIYPPEGYINHDEYYLYVTPVYYVHLVYFSLEKLAGARKKNLIRKVQRSATSFCAETAKNIPVGLYCTRTPRSHPDLTESGKYFDVISRRHGPPRTLIPRPIGYVYLMLSSPHVVGGVCRTALPGVPGGLVGYPGAYVLKSISRVQFSPSRVHILVETFLA